MILIELSEVEQRQKMASERAEKFQGILEELNKDMDGLKNNLKINFNSKMKKMKQRNVDIMNRILKLERIIEVNSLRSKCFDRNVKAESECEDKISKHEINM
jgi:Nucleoporin complex subunit 54